MEAAIIALMGFSLAIFWGGVFFYWKSKRARRALLEKEEQMEKKVYELAIMKQLAERTGYSLNVQNIIDIITGSLHQFMDYSAVSYMLLQPEKIMFKIHLEKSVNHTFVKDVQERMLKSLSALLDKDFKQSQIEQVLTGAIIVDEVKSPVKSFFNIPLVIGGEVVGILTVSDTREDVYGEEETTMIYKITQQASQAVSRLEEVIATEQRKMNALVQSMTEGVVMTDKDYRIVVVNPAAKEAVGLEDKDKVQIFDFIDHLDGKFDMRGRLEESVKLNKIMTSDEVIIKDKYYQIITAPVKSSVGLKEGEVIGGVVIFHDITHDKELERMREDFTSMMVHELRSPLNGIFMIAQLMERKKAQTDPEKIQKNVKLIRSSSESMLTLVNDLLDAAKLEAGKFELHPTPTDITELIQDRVTFYQPLAEEGKLSVKSELGEGLPNDLYIDDTRIKQVLNNLISNAIKFTQEGGSVTIQAFVHRKGQPVGNEAETAGIHWMVKPSDISLDQRDDAVIVAVTDNGAGIPPKNQEQLFNKFVQFQTRAKAAQKGTGLGLAIAKGIVEAHHGSIHVASEEGIGTTFYCVLPLRMQ